MGKPVRAVLRGRDHSNVILLPGGDEETGLSRPRLVATQRKDHPDTPCLRCLPAQPETIDVVWEYGPTGGKRDLPTLGTRVNLTYPVFMLGSRRERTGHLGTRHLQHCVGVLHDEHGKLPDG
jgi:hypothetical protein